MKDKILTILAVGGMIAAVFGILIWGGWVSNNGVSVYTDEPRDREIKATSQTFNIPIEVKGRIKYDGDFIISKDTIVEFCDVKESKKQMKQEMKVIWKEMRKGCR